MNAINRPTIRTHLTTKFIAFSIVGVIGTLAHYSILYTLVEFHSINPVIASGYGAVAGLLINYVLNYSLTFKSQQPHVKTFPKFALIAGCGLSLNQAMMGLLTQHFYYLFAQVMATAVVLIWNFYANNFWTFQSEVSAHQVKGKCSRTAWALNKGISLLALVLAIRVLTLALYPLYDPSESRYAEMGRMMLETGNWVTPLIDYGIPFWGKPPLTVWLTAASLWLGGINDFSARLPSFLLSLATVGIIFYLAKIQQRSLNHAWNTAIILTSSVLFFVMAGTVAMDPCMSFGVTLALASFWLALRKDKFYWGYLFFVGLSIGLMAKGPITLVLTGISIGLWTAITGAWLDVWKRLPWLKGTLLMLCISVPWFLVAEQKTPGFLEYFFIGEHWKRFTESGWQGDLYGNGHAHTRGMIWVYWLAAAFPWSLIFIKILISALSKDQATELLKTDDGWRLYCLLWMLSPLVFFTFSANIIWTYVLPGLPGFALLLGDWQNQYKFRTALALCVPLSFLALVATYQFNIAEFYRSQKPLVSAYQKTSKLGDNLVYYLDRPYSAQFYLHGKALQLDNLAELQDNIATSKQNYFVFKKGTFDYLPDNVKLRLEQVMAYGRFMLFHVSGGNKK